MSIQREFTIELDDCWNRIGVWSDNCSCPEIKKLSHCHNCKIYSAAGKQILERKPPDGYQQEWTKIYAEEKQTFNVKRESVTVFRLGDEFLALPSSLIVEVTEIKLMRRLPNIASPIIKGLVNNRGELYICVSLGRLMELEKGMGANAEANTKLFDRMLVVSREGRDFVFPVSEILGTCRYNPIDLEPVPSTITKAKASYTKNMLNWEGKHVACLDDELLFFSLNKALG